jgi:hypothetical protein
MRVVAAGTEAARLPRDENRLPARRRPSASPSLLKVVAALLMLLSIEAQNRRPRNRVAVCEQCNWVKEVRDKSLVC